MAARDLVWFKSSHSDADTEHSTCVEVALDTGSTAVRDSKAPGGGHLTVPHPAWSALLSSLR
ncbi:DUF397 domain-containing protein [Amycolatopsis balhimycina DSM 5908]|uniref:DUF397 domain-containing protein n=1 Tax=Amycolatopsis balhimycina DSM 5908 TaxID=1081091 RepID=A0A428WXS8_AMYBA|nr:DUF397 domain-containing protein [Amycolatopsis balhimycina]RSM47861.1 DUF397 domain-containing protein [Amycolatopsis balhimycina DSM 5908]